LKSEGHCTNINIMSKKSAILCLDDDELVLVALEYQLQKYYGGRFIYEFALDPLEGLDVISQYNPCPGDQRLVNAGDARR
jgi:hypothetical protein